MLNDETRTFKTGPPTGFGMARAWDVMLEAALAEPGIEMGIACEGTVVESRTVKVGGRAFLFLSPKKAYFKLGPSYEKAKAMGGAVKAGGGGWTSLVWDEPCPASDALLRKWVAESCSLLRASAKPQASVGLLAMKPKKAKPGKS